MAQKEMKNWGFKCPGTNAPNVQWFRYARQWLLLHPTQPKPVQYFFDIIDRGRHENKLKTSILSQISWHIPADGKWTEQQWTIFSIQFETYFIRGTWSHIETEERQRIREILTIMERNIFQ